LVTRARLAVNHGIFVYSVATEINNIKNRSNQVVSESAKGNGISNQAHVTNVLCLSLNGVIIRIHNMQAGRQAGRQRYIYTLNDRFDENNGFLKEGN
jgi:hypothetical protein